MTTPNAPASSLGPIVKAGTPGGPTGGGVQFPDSATPKPKEEMERLQKEKEEEARYLEERKEEQRKKDLLEGRRTGKAEPDPIPPLTRPPKTYYNRYPNSCFQVQIAPTIAHTIQWHGDTYTTSDPNEQDQLDACADQMGCPIYTKTAVIDPGERQAQKELQAQSAKAAKEAGQVKPNQA